MKGLLFISILSILIFSCARIGAPSGGDKDIYPPKFLNANPDTLATSVPLDLKEIRINFDEYVVLKDPQKQIVISPPGNINPLITPTVNSPRKFVSIVFKEDLLPNTTYNINFGESIQDNNEGNILPYFSYVFSTGEKIDSLTLGGNVSQALSLEKPENTAIALYKVDSTEVDLRKKPYYITKADSLSNFQFSYLHEGNYKLIAFTDENLNSRYDDNGKELLAFETELINPIANNSYSLILSENKPKYKTLKAEQIGAGKINIYMKGKPDSISFGTISENFPPNYKFYHKAYSDTAQLFFNPEDIKFSSTKERLKFWIEHNTQKDSLQPIYNTKEKGNWEVNLGKSYFVKGDIPSVKTNYYLDNIDTQYITVTKDSINIPIQSYKIKENHQGFSLDFPIEFDAKYNISIFPKALISNYKEFSDTIDLKFSTQKAEDYGNLKLTLVNPPKHPFFLQLITDKTVVKSIYGTNSNIEFKFLPPKDYNFLILVDENENGVWDAADFDNNRLAEKTYLHEDPITMRAFWDLNETWALPD